MSHRYVGSSLFLSLLASAALAQPSAPAVPTRVSSTPSSSQMPLLGREALRLGVELHDKQDYSSAIATYLRVPPSDSAYAVVQSELATSYWANEQYTEAAAAAQRALDLGMRSPQPYNALANAQDALKESDKALATYAEGLKKYPLSGLMWFNRGVSQANVQKVEAAAASFQRSLELRPLHPGSHLQLAYLELAQGHQSHALLGFLTYLMLVPDGPNSKGVLVKAEQLSMGNLEVDEKEKRTATTPNDNFGPMDELLASRVALRKDYRSPVNFQAAVVKQTQLLVEKFPLASDAASADFWQRAYGPLVEVLRQGDNLTTFTYLTLCSADDQRAAKWVKGNLPKVRKLIEAAREKMFLLRDFQVVERNGKPTKVEAWFHDSGAISGLGDARRDATGKALYEGPWQFFDEAGNLEGEGNFSNGQKTGSWRMYYPSGQLYREVSYDKDGKLTGTYRQYQENGQPEIEATYQGGEPVGKAKLFLGCGALGEERTYDASGKQEGPYVRYFSNGQVRERGTRHLDETDGPLTAFFADGSPEGDATLKAGKVDGTTVRYFPGPGKHVEYRSTLVQDQLSGPYTSYFINGQINETGSYANDKRTGTWKTYYPDGKLSTERAYDKDGKDHGVFRDYDIEGRPFCEITYDHGRARKLQFIDPSGKPGPATNLAVNGDVPVRGLRADGTPLYNGTYRQGLRHGEWTYVYRHGTPSERQRYRDDKLDGVQETFHPNGKVNTRLTYADGEKHGRYEQYAADGVLREEGWYVHGQRHGQWRQYHADGTLNEEYGYHMGEMNGVQRSFTADGKLYEEMWRKENLPVHIIDRDTTGKVLNDVQLKPDADGYVLNFASGKPRLRYKLSCGLYSGIEEYYPSGQLRSTVSMLQGDRNGPFKSYYANGKLRTQGQYLDGSPDGEWTYYLPDGTLSRKGSYTRGEKNGEWTYYHANGKVSVVEPYLADDLHGISRRFDPAGQLMYEKRYHLGSIMAWRHPQADGQPGSWQDLSSQNGTVKSYYANGKVSAEETYRNGLLDGVLKLYHSNGQLMRENTHRNGQIEGVEHTYAADGKLLEEENYQHDELQGRSRYYRPDGSLAREESWRFGQQYGPTVYYNAQGKPERTEFYWNDNVYGSK